MQEEVYSEVVSPLVQSFTSGINCTVFAYGQTSSGKTYTLGSNTLASLSTTEDQGIIFRAIEEVFCVLREQENKNEEVGEGGGGGGGGRGRRNEVRVSYIEVYKEEVRDLLAEGSLDSDVIHIREDEAGRTGLITVSNITYRHTHSPFLSPVVLGVTEEVVGDVEEALGWLEAGSIARVTSSTAMNEHSSRSHAIFTLTLGKD